jgi:hypothetical protein
MSFTKKRIDEMREQAGYAIAYINGVINYLDLLKPKIKDKIQKILDKYPPPRKVLESVTLARTLKHAIKNYKSFKRSVEIFAVLNTTHGIDLKIKPKHEAAFAPESALAPASAFAPASASASAFAPALAPAAFAPASAFAPAAFAPASASAAFAPASASAFAPASARGGRKTGRKSGRKTGRKTYKRMH